MNKVKLNNRYNYLYDIVNGEREQLYHKCVYCGDPADTRDHVPAISRIDDYKSLGLEHEKYIKVPCCKECNCLASDTLQDSFINRVEYVKDRLSRKYRSLIKPIHWDDDEIEELGPNLRTAILRNKKKRARAIQRLEYYASVELILNDIEV